MVTVSKFLPPITALRSTLTWPKHPPNLKIR